MSDGRPPTGLRNAGTFAPLLLEADGTVAGIVIGGTAEKPTLTLFSDPATAEEKK